MNDVVMTMWLGLGSMVLSALSAAVGLTTLGYLLRVWEEKRERRAKR